MRAVLICHEGAEIALHVIAPWLKTFCDEVAVVVLHETRKRVWRRIRREIKRIGILRFLDVLAFRFYYKLRLAKTDHAWEQRTIGEFSRKYPPSTDLPTLHTHSPNSPEAQKFIADLKPDFVVALCKSLLAERIFSIPTHGTLVFHPGICPEYRNSHGCFWALANEDLEKVGMSLLRIDKGIDTGPIFEYFTYPYDEVNESHIRIQTRVVLENLDAIRAKIGEICADKAERIDIRGRPSAEWGQPWLTRYLRWKRRAKRRART